MHNILFSPGLIMCQCSMIACPTLMSLPRIVLKNGFAYVYWRHYTAIPKYVIFISPLDEGNTQYTRVSFSIMSSEKTKSRRLFVIIASRLPEALKGWSMVATCHP